jgi:nucleotide-binding universal stress UspA family protein
MARALPRGMRTEPSQIVIGYDFSKTAREALGRALRLAERAPFHVLHFVCAIDPHMPFPHLPTKHVDAEYAERVQAAATEAVTEELKRLDITTELQFFIHARIGKPADEILGVARDVGADLILVGSKGLTGLERLVLGSVAERVVREAGCTVEVVRPRTYSHVPLLQMVEVEQQRTYSPPHRYTYRDKQVTLRPINWPLY